MPGTRDKLIINKLNELLFVYFLFLLFIFVYFKLHCVFFRVTHIICTEACESCCMNTNHILKSTSTQTKQTLLTVFIRVVKMSFELLQRTFPDSGHFLNSLTAADWALCTVLQQQTGWSLVCLCNWLESYVIVQTITVQTNNNSTFSRQQKTLRWPSEQFNATEYKHCIKERLDVR